MNSVGANPLLQVRARCCQAFVGTLLALTWRTPALLVPRVASTTLEAPPQEARGRTKKLKVTLVSASLAARIPCSRLVAADLTQRPTETAFRPLSKLEPLTCCT